MPCPCPPPLPPLRELLQALGHLAPPEAEHHMETLESLEERQANTRARLAHEEASLARVVPDGTRSASEAWCLYASAVSAARRASRQLAVDEAVLRESLEDALFWARQRQAQGVVHCAACRGTGEDSRPAPGSALEGAACPACEGRGRVRLHGR
ncbi:hypothetical protein [Archangium primigenium]|uniref:hypothetical protein n=1 Tax=[Archangium] primigenium TaxID=2792470 RepID=UPI001957EB9E|nr:hypothetical protein [Archangium primigenium]MBM7117617.1 hypothetical protein [Archangium primigenium]